MSRWDEPGTGSVGTPGEGGSPPGRSQLWWCPLPHLNIPPTSLGAQSWCSSSPMGGGHPALPACALGTWHSRGAELRAGVLLRLSTHSAAQGLSALLVSLGAIGMSWHSPWASLPEVPEGHSVPRPGDPRPQRGQRPLSASTRAPLLWGPSLGCAPQPCCHRSRREAGNECPPTWHHPMPRACAAGDMCSPGPVAVGGHICPTLVPSSLEGLAQGQLRVPLGTGTTQCPSWEQLHATVRHRDSSVSTLGTGTTLSPLGMGTAQCP